MRAILSYPAFALAALAAHLSTNGRYGYFRDELYLLACGDHLDWGYVDHAPLIALVAKVSRFLLGDSLHAIRFFPALAHALLIVLTGLITRELGGKSFAIALACLGVLLAPVFLIFGTLLSMNAFEPLFWMGGAYVLLLAIQRDKPRLLLWLGLLVGIGLENKHSTVF
ncbi:MAG: glycosyltransferase family 39 protein, partial [Acidobacteria bacterium]|nr:glycosyltransferase family 39 protein [Acidobacteriota bacterium]